MLQLRDLYQSVRRAQAKSRSRSRTVVAIAFGLLAPLVVSCGQSGRASAPPVRELTPIATDVALGGGAVADSIAVHGVDTALPGDEASESSAPSCRTTFDSELAQSDTVQQSPVQLVLDGVRVAQDDDARCGQRSTEEIYCRALWLLEVLDPVVVAFDPSVSPDERLEAAASIDWALTTSIDAPVAVEEPATVEGLSIIAGEGDVGEMSVGNAFAQLRPLTASLAEALEGVDATSQLTTVHEDRLALLIGARAHPTILEPLSAMQTACLLGG